MYEVLRTLLIVIGTGCIAAGLVVSYREWAWRQWGKAHGKRSWLLDTLLVTNVIQDAVGLWFLAVTILRMLGMQLPQWFTLITMVGLSILFAKKVWRHHMVVKHADRELMRPPDTA